VLWAERDEGDQRVAQWERSGGEEEAGELEGDEEKGSGSKAIATTRSTTGVRRVESHVVLKVVRAMGKRLR